MKPRIARFVLLILIVVLMGAAVVIPVAAQEGPGAEPVATTRILPDQVLWRVRVPYQYDAVVLTVSGPGDFVQSYEFPRTQAPRFLPTGAGGAALPDGVYNYELMVMPTVGPEARAALDAAVESRDPAVVEGLQARGLLPDGPFLQTGTFTIRSGRMVALEPDEEEGSREPSDTPMRDQVIPDDLIVQSSLCVGLDCVNNENFGFDTIRLKENNTRIKFEDTSVGNFPSTDWQLTANDSASGGQNRFSIEDITASRIPFTVEGGATTNSLYIDSTGRVGFRTSTPVLDLHVATGNTPGMRLEQQGTGGFTPQTWDVGANEANFFIRDVTGGSLLSFRIRPGAPTSSLDINSIGNVGIGTSSPTQPLHVRRSNGTAQVFVEEASTTSAFRNLLVMSNFGPPGFSMVDRETPTIWNIGHSRFGTGNFMFHSPGPGGVGGSQAQAILDRLGNLELSGTLTESTNPTFARAEPSSVAGGNILASLANLPILSSTASDSGRHIMPSPEEFNRAYGVGDSESIAPTDVATVALMGIQQLHRLVGEQQATIEEQAARIAALEAQVATLTGQPGVATVDDTRLAELEERVKQLELMLSSVQPAEEVVPRELSR